LSTLSASLIHSLKTACTCLINGSSQTHAFLSLTQALRSFRRLYGFGAGTIRQFLYNVSELKKPQARDYEDMLQVSRIILVLRSPSSNMLQCSIIVFEGLLGEPFNSYVLDALYVLCFWHSLAKMRVHTESTLVIFKDATVALGWYVRRLATAIDSHFDVKESQREFNARKKRADKAQAAGATAGPDRREGKKLNLNTTKFHTLGYYTHYIRRHGTSDGTSTQIVRTASSPRSTA
jgi:hypothetical protein